MACTLSWQRAGDFRDIVDVCLPLMRLFTRGFTKYTAADASCRSKYVRPSGTCVMPYSYLITVSACMLAIVITMADAEADERRVIGWIERVGVTDANVVIDAKMDTGADNSSLNAAHQETFEREAAKWVRFQVINPEGKILDIERPVVRTARIKRHEGGQEERQVIRLGLCIGRLFKMVDVNLVNRDGFSQPLLVGRSFLEGDFVVDSALRYTVEPACNGK